MSKGYCPYCMKEVFVKKEDFRVGLAIFLLIFTAGFGLFIYLLVYLDKKADRCIFCGSKCQPLLLHVQSNANATIVATTQSSNQSATQLVYPMKQAVVLEAPHFCPNCGAELEDNGTLKFCSLCGTKINE